MITTVSMSKKRAQVIVNGDEVRKLNFSGLNRAQHLELIQKAPKITRHIRRVHQGNLWSDAYGTQYRYNGVTFQIYDPAQDTQAA